MRDGWMDHYALLTNTCETDKVYTCTIEREWTVDEKIAGIAKELKEIDNEIEACQREKKMLLRWLVKHTMAKNRLHEKSKLGCSDEIQLSFCTKEH